MVFYIPDIVIICMSGKVYYSTDISFKEFSHTENAFIIHIQIPLCDMSVFIFKDDVNKQQYNKWDDYDWFLIIFFNSLRTFPVYIPPRSF